MDTTTRKQQMADLRMKGVSITKIGKIHGISHQAVSQILLRYLGKDYASIFKVIYPDTKIKNICKRCGVEYKTNNSKSKFCSRYCTRTLSLMNREELTRYNTDRLRRYRQTKKGRERVRAAVKKSILKYPDRQRAREKLNCAVKSNKIIKPNMCSICGLQRKIEAHHEDYSRPLDVIWVCRSCHNLLDKHINNSV